MTEQDFEQRLAGAQRANQGMREALEAEHVNYLEACAERDRYRAALEGLRKHLDFVGDATLDNATIRRWIDDALRGS